MTADDANEILLLGDDTPCYARAIYIHRTHKNKPLDIRPGSFLEAIYRDKSNYIVCIKATQCGISEFLTVKAFYLAEKGCNVFYVFPTYELKNNFVRERIDKMIMNTAYYLQLMTNRESRYAENMSLKHVQNGAIAFVGSNSANSFLSFPADVVIIDELDNCDQSNIIMASERQSASTDKSTVKVGNPTIRNYGIDLEYRATDKKQWHIKHDCGAWIQPDFFRHVVRQVSASDYVAIDTEWDGISDNIRCICDKCGKSFDRYGRGEWQAQAQSDRSGYQISKMFSTTVTIKDIMDRFSEGLLNESAMQRFYNGDLGLPYTARGAKVTREMLDGCIESYIMPEFSRGVCVMGADVGKLIHITIAELLPDGRKRLMYIGSVRDEDDVAELYAVYNCRIGVIDSRPETRLSKRLSSRFAGLFMCDYIHGIKDTIDAGGKIIKVDRTQALDAVKEAIVKRALILPQNAASLPEFYEHMEASTRVLNERTGNYEWVEAGADHLNHALAYMLKAEKLLSML